MTLPTSFKRPNMRVSFSADFVCGNIEGAEDLSLNNRLDVDMLIRATRNLNGLHKEPLEWVPQT